MAELRLGLIMSNRLASMDKVMGATKLRTDALGATRHLALRWAQPFAARVFDGWMRWVRDERTRLDRLVGLASRRAPWWWLLRLRVRARHRRRLRQATRLAVANWCRGALGVAFDALLAVRRANTATANCQREAGAL